MIKIKDLIVLLEKATGPDRGFDLMIAEAVGLKPGHGATGARVGWHEYTASIDAALTLVPKGYEWSVDGNKDGTGDATVSRDFSGGIDMLNWEKGATPAIAFCIVALRACDALTRPQRERPTENSGDHPGQPAETKNGDR